MRSAQEAERANKSLLHGKSIEEVKARLLTLSEYEKINLLNARDDAGETALHRASRIRNSELIGFLIDENTDLKIRNVLNKTAGQIFIGVELEDEANSDEANPYRADIHDIATLFIHRKFFDEILQKKGEKNFIPDEIKLDLSFKNTKGITPLQIASECGNESIVNYLIEKQVNLNDSDNDGMTALHKAVKNGFFGAVNLLVSAGADINARNTKGETPLSLARNQEGKSLELHLFAITHKEDTQYNKEIFNSLIANGININAKSSDGLTALEFAHSCNNAFVKRCIIEKIANDASPSLDPALRVSSTNKKVAVRVL